jgi:putative SOS response-associated peptidase YedK
MDSAF